MISIIKISQKEWISRWAGSYTYISCSFWGHQYNESIKKILGKGFENVLFIHRKGTVTFYVPKNELSNLGMHLANKVQKNKKEMLSLLKLLKKNSDILTPMMKRLGKKIPTSKEFAIFYKYFDRHLAYHVFMKKTVDFLPIEILDELLPKFKDARIYSEHIYSDSETFFRNIARNIAKKEGYDYKNITCLTRKEFIEYMKDRTLPKKEILKKRFSSSALFFYREGKKQKEIEFLGKDVDKLEKQIFESLAESKIKEVKGMVAYPGKVKGICKIILNPFEEKRFNDGEILITGMTRPEFTKLFVKSGAVVTDVGGMLCHASIAAREFKKPCIVGTHTATKVFKNGDLVEVDATKGTVRKIKG